MTWRARVLLGRKEWGITPGATESSQVTDCPLAFLLLKGFDRVVRERELTSAAQDQGGNDAGEVKSPMNPIGREAEFHNVTRGDLEFGF